MAPLMPQLSLPIPDSGSPQSARMTTPRLSDVPPALPEGMEAQEPFAIQKHHLDTHHHVNNCQYIRMGADYLPEGFEIRQMRAEYKKQALLGDVFYQAVKLEAGKVTVALSAENGEPYAIVEFMSA